MAATPAVRALVQARATYVLHEYDPAAGDGAHGYGEVAVAALGADPAQVFKTLIATVDGRLTVAVVPVSGQLDLKALAAAAGGRKAAMADPADAELDEFVGDAAVLTDDFAPVDQLLTPYG